MTVRNELKNPEAKAIVGRLEGQIKKKKKTLEAEYRARMREQRRTYRNPLDPPPVKKSKGIKPKVARKKTSGTTVYGLYDAQGNLRYIGQTRSSLTKRLAQHYSDSSKGLYPVHWWIAGVLQRGETVDIRVIKAKAIWDVDEVVQIDKAIKAGSQLLNQTRGGVYHPNMTVATKAKLKQQAKDLVEKLS